MTLAINTSLLPRLPDALGRWRAAGGRQGACEGGWAPLRASEAGVETGRGAQGPGRTRSSSPPGTVGSVTQKPRPEAKVLQGGPAGQCLPGARGLQPLLWVLGRRALDARTWR